MQRHAARSQPGWPYVVAALGLLVVMSGCEPKGPKSSHNSADPIAEGDHFSLRPQSMRVYPSTRFVNRAADTILEARIEFFDEMGDSVKAVGRLHFELLRSSTQKDATPQKLYEWPVSLLTLDEQKRHYDSVLRVYLFRLRAHEDAVSRESPELHVMFTGVDGVRLQARTVLNADFAAPAPTSPPAAAIESPTLTPTSPPEPAEHP